MEKKTKRKNVHNTVRKHRNTIIIRVDRVGTYVYVV